MAFKLHNQAKNSNSLPRKQDNAIGWIELIETYLATLGTSTMKISRVASLEITSFDLNSTSSRSFWYMNHDKTPSSPHTF